MAPDDAGAVEDSLKKAGRKPRDLGRWLAYTVLRALLLCESLLARAGSEISTR